MPGIKVRVSTGRSQRRPHRNGRQRATKEGPWSGCVSLPLRGTVISVVSCAVGPNYRTPELPTPGEFAAHGATPPQTAPAAAPLEPATWWHALDDPELDSLIERAVKANPDLQIALDRLQAARTVAIGTWARLPAAEASAGGGRGTGSDLGRGRASQQLVSAETRRGTAQVNLLAGFDAAWSSTSSVSIGARLRRRGRMRRLRRRRATWCSSP